MKIHKLHIKSGLTLGNRAMLALLFALWMLAGCSEEQAVSIPSQKWEGMDVRVESRPSPPRSGMNEFVVMVTGAHGRPAYNLIVSLRTDDHDAWTQAIQDGQLGIYRRAAEVAPGVRSVLQVQIRHDDTESVLRFPLGMVSVDQ